MVLAIRHPSEDPLGRRERHDTSPRARPTLRGREFDFSTPRPTASAKRHDASGWSPFLPSVIMLRANLLDVLGTPCQSSWLGTGRKGGPPFPKAGTRHWFLPDPDRWAILAPAPPALGIADPHGWSCKTRSSCHRMVHDGRLAGPSACCLPRCPPGSGRPVPGAPCVMRCAARSPVRPGRWMGAQKTRTLGGTGSVYRPSKLRPLGVVILRSDRRTETTRLGR